LVFATAMVNMQDHIPIGRRWLEALHLCLNTGNAWYELTRVMLHWLLEADGTRRNPNSPRSDSSKWPQSSSGSIQKRVWLLQGFDFQQHEERELCPTMQRPITTFHGAQVHKLLDKCSQQWEVAPLIDALEAIQADGDFRGMIRDLLDGWYALSRVHSCVNSHPLEGDKLRSAVKDFKRSLWIFDWVGIPTPCRYRMRFSDHAIRQHVYEQSVQLRTRARLFHRGDV
jgi:hypothetical protein